MARHRTQRGRRPSGAWIVLTILGLCRVPLPWPDYHVVRHQDGPGQVCEHHEHLLRWHPNAGEGEGASVAHWHWAPLRPFSTGERSPGDEPDLLSSVPEELGLLFESAPARPVESSKRWQGPPLADGIGLPVPAALLGDNQGVGPLAVTGAPPCAVSRPSPSLLQRWNC